MGDTKRQATSGGVMSLRKENSQLKELVASPAYIVLSAAGEFRHKTKRVHELGQTDFIYFKTMGWGWYYLSTVLGDFSRFIIAWFLTSGMRADDVKNTLELAISKTGVSGVQIRHRTRPLSDNGSCYLAADLQEYLEECQEFRVLSHM